MCRMRNFGMSAAVAICSTWHSVPVVSVFLQKPFDIHLQKSVNSPTVQLGGVVSYTVTL